MSAPLSSKFVHAVSIVLTFHTLISLRFGPSSSATIELREYIWKRERERQCDWSNVDTFRDVSTHRKIDRKIDRERKREIEIER